MVVHALSSAETQDPVTSAPALLDISFKQMVSIAKVKEIIVSVISIIFLNEQD